MNRYSGLSYPETPTLFFEFHGSESYVVEQAERTQAILTRHGMQSFQWAAGKGERDRLWEARHNGYYASLGLREGAIGYVTDVCVPVSNLAECIRRTKEDLADCSIPAPLFGHVGDGNFHVVFPIMPDADDELAEVHSLSRKITAHALALEGTCTGEHGIGIGKLDALKREHTSGVDVMRAIKQALDPEWLMNPGKVLATSESGHHSPSEGTSTLSNGST